MRKPMQSVIFFVGITGLFVFSVLLNQRLQQFTFPKRTDYQATIQNMSPLLFKVLSFGHLPVVVDSIWIRAVTDSEMTRFSEKNEHSPQFYAFKLLVELDPSFFTAYWVGGNLLAIVRDDPKGAVEILERGMNYLQNHLPNASEEFRKRHWPAPWFIPYFLGYVYLFELKNLQKAAEVLKELNKYPNTPFVWANMAKKLEKPEGIYDLGINYINHLVVAADTPEIAENFMKRKNDLLLSRHLFMLNREFDEYRKTRKSDQTLFEKFTKIKSVSLKDPFGGDIFLDSKGKIDSTTPRQKVLGLE